MTYFGKLGGTSLRLMLLIGLVIMLVLPVRSWVFAQNGSAPLWVVRSFTTKEFGINEPQGLAFSSKANTFFILDGAGNIAPITMGEDSLGLRVISEVQLDPLNAAFDDRTDSLFVFNRGKSELAKIKVDSKGLPDASAASMRFAADAFGIKDPQGVAFDPASGRLFILDADTSQIVSVVPHPTLGFDANEAIRSNKVERVSLKNLKAGVLRGVAYHPINGHLYVSDPGQKKLYELTQSGDLVSGFDLAALGIDNLSAMTFAPSADNTDDPSIFDLFILDARVVSSQQDASSDSQIVELSLAAPAALPSGTTLISTTLVHIIDTSKAAWNPSAPDPAGIDYWPLTGRLLISDSEVEEMPAYWVGKNVFQSTTSGTLVSTCSTTAFSNEPTGLAINPNNNHIFFSDDTGSSDKVFEVSLGADGQYCTADDTVTITNVASLYRISDAEDVAYGNNTLFVAGGSSAEVYRIPLGANGVLGGGDDGAMTHFDTASLGFADMEALGYNADADTLFIASPKATDRYLGETTTTGKLLRAYDLSLMGAAGNIRSDVTYAPGSQNPAIKNIYIASRGVDNDSSRLENDGQVWEISLGSSQTTPTATASPSGTLPGQASLVSPSGIISSTTPTYTWNKVSSATWYYLWVSRVNNDGSFTTMHSKWYESSTVCGSSTCSFAPAVTLSPGNYRWWIQTWNAAGYGPWSSPKNFTLPTPPGAATLVSPSGTITDTTPTYTWNKVSSATWYYLWVSKVNSDGSLTTMHSKWYESSAVCGSSTCSFTPAVTLSSGNYRWWIQTWNDGGYGPWSSPLNFTVSP